jgi:hypothetical protein
MALRVAWRSHSTVRAAASDSTTALMLIRALRHSNRNTPRIRSSSRAPSSRAVLRLPRAASRKLAGRNSELSTSTPAMPGARPAIASSTSAVTSRVLAPGNFSTTSSSPGPSPKTASPISGWWSSTTLVTSPRRSARPSSSVSATATLARSPGVTMGRTWRMPRRWLGVSTNPPVPGVEASRKVRGDTARALPAVSTTWLRVMPCSRSRSGSAWTWSWRSRWPQMATFATPGTPIRWGRMVQRASTDSSIGVSFSDDSPIIMTRLVDDSGWSICGGLDTWGRAWAWMSRSWTTWRALSGSVPGSKIISIRDSPGTDSERMVSSQATPLSRSCSRGTVMSCSTSAGDSPRASVWTSTVGGVNSGRASTGMSRSWVAPNTSRAAASTITTPRDRRLHPMIQPITAASRRVAYRGGGTSPNHSASGPANGMDARPTTSGCGNRRVRPTRDSVTSG